MGREGAAGPSIRCAVPLPPTLPAQPAPDDGRPEWLRGAPQVAVDVWAVVRGLQHNEYVAQPDLIAAVPDVVDDHGRLRVEAVSTLRALDVRREYGPLVDGRAEVRWRRAPWQAPAPCSKCGRAR